MILIVVVHLLCASAFEPLFAAHLNTHLCFAIFATQVARVNYYGLLDKWLACWTQAQKAWVQISVATLSGNSLRQTVHTHCSPSSRIGSSPLKDCRGNCGPGGK